MRKTATVAMRKTESQSAPSDAENRCIQPPKAMRKTGAYLDNHLHGEERSSAQPPSSAAPRSQHAATDHDEDTFTSVGDVLVSLRKQVEPP